MINLCRSVEPLRGKLMMNIGSSRILGKPEELIHKPNHGHFKRKPPPPNSPYLLAANNTRDQLATRQGVSSSTVFYLHAAQTFSAHRSSA